MSMKREVIVAQPISTIVDGWALLDGSLNLVVEVSPGVRYSIVVKTQREPKRNTR